MCQIEAHTSDTCKGWHMERLSQIATVPSRTPVRPGFRSGPYLEKLLAELDRAQISARIKQARDEAGLTQPELADLLQSHWRTVQEWENLKNGNVPWDRLDEIAQATGRTRDWLLHGDQAASPETMGAVQKEMAEIRELLERLLERLPKPPNEPEQP